MPATVGSVATATEASASARFCRQQGFDINTQIRTQEIEVSGSAPSGNSGNDVVKMHSGNDVIDMQATDLEKHDTKVHDMHVAN
jgi:hypothetical protein